MKEREYYGEREAKKTLDWLNDNSTPGSKLAEERANVLKRITNILSGLQQDSESNDRLNSIRTSLEGFVLRPSTRRGEDGRLVLYYHDESDELAWLFGEAFHVVLDLFRLADMGVIDRILQCPVCGAWFFGKTRIQECCSRPCGEAYQKTDKKKQHRNERLKQNRRTGPYAAYGKPKSRIKRGRK
jgi:hypothetical protein